jgi:hypothetical protein
MFASKKGHTVVSVVEDEFEGEKYTSYVMSAYSVDRVVNWVVMAVVKHLIIFGLIYMAVDAIGRSS